MQVSENGEYFVEEGHPFFYMADTAWAAFYAMSMEEWNFYLSKRHKQGFTAVQISALPILNDISRSRGLQPFAARPDGGYDFSKPNTGYWNHARSKVEAAYRLGIRSAIVVLWCCYLPDSWAGQRFPEHAVDYGQIEPYCKMLCSLFEEFEPFYFISGDTRFEPETTRYYLRALECVKRFAPSCLTAMHMGPDVVLPSEIANSACLDFYTYQSGHEIEQQQRAYTLAEQLNSLPFKRPVINAEPCYDGHGYGFGYGRFGSFEVRRAVLQGLLAGAKAGFAYGSHGVWNWHRSGSGFSSPGFSDYPADAWEAMERKGAWDCGYIRWLYESGQFYRFRRDDDLLAERRGGEIFACSEGERDRIILYAPYDTRLQVCCDLRQYDGYGIALDDKRIITPQLSFGSGDTTIGFSGCSRDILFIFKRRST